MTPNWCCLLCHRSGEKETPEEAAQEHRNALLADAQNNKQMARIHPGFVGPLAKCAGDIRMKEKQPKKGPRIPSGILGGEEPWL